MREDCERILFAFLSLCEVCKYPNTPNWSSVVIFAGVIFRASAIFDIFACF